MADVLKQVQAEMHRYVARIQSEQEPDGSWRYDFENGPMTDAGMLLLLSALVQEDLELTQRLARRLIRQQAPGGEWKLYDDDGGHLSSTIEAYTSLLLTGRMERNAPEMKRAEAYILRHGGVEKAHVSTKCMLALNGLYPWPKRFPLPLFLIRLPRRLPLGFHRWSSYVKAHFAPLLILGHMKFVLPHPSGIDIHHLYATEKHRKLGRQQNIRQRSHRNRRAQGDTAWRSNRERLALQQAERYILEHIEGDGTLYSYTSATFFMIYALLAIGYRPNSPVVIRALQGLRSFVTQKDGGEAHLQNSPSTVWDTALAAYALQEAGLPAEDEAVQRAIRYLLPLQHAGSAEARQGDGGWGFSENNTANPDVDDTQAALRALTRSVPSDAACSAAWLPGMRYLFRMQNDDGGWAAFERNSRSVMTRLFTFENFEDTALDPSAADITGRTLEFLGSHAKLTLAHPRVQAAAEWLLRRQRPDGSWHGRWGVTYVYGTWAAVTGLRAVGLPARHPALRRAADWLLRIRQSDGGWGESCRSDAAGAYVPAPYSTVVQTAWALDALIAVYDQPTGVMEEAMPLLIAWNREEGGRRAAYPTGAGLPGHFYIRYHSYPRIWPLLTLAHYAQKYGIV